MACHAAASRCPRALSLHANSALTLPCFLQPILSPSILDHLINNDRKLPPEYNLPHTYVEMQVRGGVSLPRARGAAQQLRIRPALRQSLPTPLCKAECCFQPATVRASLEGIRTQCCTQKAAKCATTLPTTLPLCPSISLCVPLCSLQSLQIAAFLFTVCHVVIVVQDWFTDLSLYR